MSISLSIHNSFRGGNLRLSACVFDYENAALRLCTSDDNGTVADIAFFLNNDALTAALVKAINGAVAEAPAAPVVIEGEAA